MSVRMLAWGPDQLQWTQLGCRKGGTWDEAGVRFLGRGSQERGGKRVQLGNVTFQRPRCMGSPLPWPY